MDMGREPATDLSRRVGIGQLAAGGAEICRGFPHLALLLLLHCLLQHPEKDKPRLNATEKESGEIECCIKYICKSN